MNFLRRHIGSSKNQIEEMYKILGVDSHSLINNVIPKNIRSNFENYPLKDESIVLQELNEKMNKNKINHNMIGLDFNESVLPNVIKRNLLENPRWYT